MYVNLSKLPDAPRKYQATLSGLYGGLNTKRLPTEIAGNQCAQLLNMLWRDGALHSRYGQEAVLSDANAVLPNPEIWWAWPLMLYDRAWHEHLFFAIAFDAGEAGIYIAAYSLRKKSYKLIHAAALGHPLTDHYKENGGAFFRFGEKLYYKNRGIYVEISHSLDDADNDVFTAQAVEPYCPIIQINTGRSGVGDLYQPENRMSSDKEIWFNADSGSAAIELPCDGKSLLYNVGIATRLVNGGLADNTLFRVEELYVGATLMTQVASEPKAETEYSVDVTRGNIQFFTPPAVGLKITARVTLSARRYRLPDNLRGVEFLSVTVGGEEYVYDPHADFVTPGAAKGKYTVVSYGADYAPPELLFSENLGLWNDANYNANRIKIKFRVPNDAAKRSIEDCYVAAVYGATGIEANCVVLAGSTAQPNAFFWSGSDANGANPAYFPMDQYNLVGEYDDPVTAFGRQQDRLVIFQESRVSSATYDFTSVDGRLTVSLNTKTIHDQIGCDLPKTIQVIENNLVWANTKHGVLYLKDSTYAYETLVVCISGNVNDDREKIGGLLSAARSSSRRSVCSFDDGQRYWLCLQDAAYVWDYELRGYTADTEKLCWFKMDGISAIAWAVDAGIPYAISPTALALAQNDGISWLFTFGKSFVDFGKPFLRILQPQTQNFGTYDYYKNVQRLVVSLDSREPMCAQLLYLTDYGERMDQTDLLSDAAVTSIEERNVPSVRVRAPKCIHVHEFAFRLSSADGGDLNLISAQIFYTICGRTKAGRHM